jgi:hypothetical protein
MMLLNVSYEIHITRTWGLKLSVKITVFLGYDAVYFGI